MKRAYLSLLLFATILTACANDVADSRAPLIHGPTWEKGVYRLEGSEHFGALVWSPKANIVAGLIGRSPNPIPDCVPFPIGCWAMALGRPGFNSEIFTIDLQNEVRHQVIKTDEDSRLISTVFWVPDGKHLGFIVSQYGNKDTYVGTWSIGVDGKEDVWISAETDRPLVSPDGTMIAMTDGRSVSLRYASTNRDHEIYRVQDPRSTIDRLAWSPDSTRLTFYSKVASVSTILVLEVNTGSVVNTNIRVFNDWLAPQLSPDHNLIAFMGSTVVIRDLMRNCQVELPFQDVKDVSWSPDGSMLLVDTFDVTYILKLQEFAAPLFQRTGAVCSRP